MRFADTYRVAFLAAGCSIGLSATASTFDPADLDFEFGTGSQQAVLVIDWFDGRDALAWGYNFDAGATVADMLIEITDQAAGLHTRLTEFSGLGFAVIGLGYDRDLDGFAISDGLQFDSGELFVGPASDGAVALDGDDSYSEGFATGFWGLWTSASNPFDGGAWQASSVGISGTALTDGGFFGLGWDPTFAFFGPDPSVVAPGSPVAAFVPAPGVGAMASLALMTVGVRRRR